MARRTKYSLMSSGLHGTNGIDPITGYNIYRTYVLPQLLNGLETLPINLKHIETLEKFHRDTLRNIHSLPQRTAKNALYLIGRLTNRRRDPREATLTTVSIPLCQ